MNEGTSTTCFSSRLSPIFADEVKYSRKYVPVSVRMRMIISILRDTKSARLSPSRELFSSTVNLSGDRLSLCGREREGKSFIIPLCRGLGVFHV